MENMSKALIMAGGLLISLVIISMLMLMINSLTSYQKINNAGSESDTVAAFNKQYEAFNRDDVRGNDLFSLANKVIDYNRRRTANEVADYDNGSALGYMPMKLSIDFAGENKQFATDGENNLLLIKDSYTASGGSNNELAAIINDVTELENKYPKDVLNLLAINITRIFINIDEETEEPEEIKKNKIKAIDNFNKCYGKEILSKSEEYDSSWDVINGLMPLRDDTTIISNDAKTDVYTYYEFIQFKRGIFRCTEVKKDEDTGRFTEMDFEFTGNFE